MAPFIKTVFFKIGCEPDVRKISR